MAGLSKIEAIESQPYANKLPSPFTKEEEEWLQKVIGYYIMHNDMDVEKEE
ncbi:hypothetical protein [Bacillus sp. HSf4]|uniref:hypothetical protein n=1 Tax=Bacillus sp. HSf4 TaxID=3035514 RepID=UPI00240A26BB|nr:hypothetical protein [Bacillus sp. HSf4]WFA05576.1 hypothetical protein P3X63_01570 [Bacillus sp. HSf4]